MPKLDWSFKTHNNLWVMIWELVGEPKEKAWYKF